MIGGKADIFENRQSLGKYRILEKIGSGGMGEVCLAKDMKLDRKVALKILPPEFAANADRMSRFIREAKSASALNHPNIITIYEIEEADGTHFIATEFIEGITLSERIAERSLDLPTALGVAIQIASALDAAHQAGIIHRDIKPDNIMIRPDDLVKLLDFGIAKLSDAQAPVDVLKTDMEAVTAIKSEPTSPGVIIGTVNYMSPEQARGKQTDARTDIWSSGIVLYEILARRLPFRGETINHTIVEILEKEPLALPHVPDELQRIVRKALCKDRELRYQSAKDFLNDLKNLQSNLSLQSELERSGSPHREAHTDSFQENPTQFYSETTFEDVKRATDSNARTIVDTVIPARSFYWKAVLLLFVGALIASAVWWYSVESTREKLPAGFMKSVGITSWSSGPNELIVEASFSPDAKMIAFGSSRADSTDIWVKPTIGGEPIQVTKNGFYNQYPVWSPNGQEIAYFSSRGEKRGIWRVSFTGGDQTEVTSNVSAGTKPRRWAKSGKIYFQEHSELFSVDIGSGETERLTDFKSRGLEPRAIEVSADETNIVFSIKENDLWKIKVMRLGAEQSDEIAASKDQIDYLAWHPAGKSVIFSATVEGIYQIFETSAESAAAAAQLSTGNDDFFVEDISSDGNQILYWSQDENSDLWTVGVTDGQESLLANSTASEYWASVSPDGDSVVYQSVAKVNRPFSGAIEVKSLTAAAPLKVSADGFSPVWSANGEWIAFFRRAEKEVEIWRVQPTGDLSKKLTSGEIQAPGYTSTPYLKIGTNQLAFSPNADAVTYGARRDGKSNIWIATLDGLRDELLTDNQDPAETVCCPAWTPDGKRFIVSSVYNYPEQNQSPISRLWLYTAGNAEKKLLLKSQERIRFLGIGNEGNDAVIAVIPVAATTSSTPENIDINLVSLETGVSAKVTTLRNAYTHNIHLSPDGKTVAFVSRRANITEIWTVPVGGGVPRRLLAENDPKVFLSSLSWSPDGKSIVFGKQSQTSLLSMLSR